jgi:hypothetical protein
VIKKSIVSFKACNKIWEQKPSINQLEKKMHLSHAQTFGMAI